MRWIVMLQNIQERYERLLNKRKTLLQRLEAYSTETLSFKAGPDKWSAVEAIEHLVVVEDNILEQVKANTPMSTLDLENRSPKNYQMVLKVMRSDVAVDVPHESIEPSGQYSLEALLARWDDIRVKMQGLLNGIEAGTEDNMVFNHPFGGPLNIRETLEFIEVHFDNHARHMEVILARAE